ncbi:hypothetical protein V1498_15255 [Peribacillus sp. SCS-26]|uniref:hypothetical protein n=1 Tax=Paraperibacillus marinus TaxID=3115295 RepID=UPI003906A1D4
MMDVPGVRCPVCQMEAVMDEKVITSQSNQNIIYTCPNCHFTKRNIKTNKG